MTRGTASQPAAPPRISRDTTPALPGSTGSALAACLCLRLRYLCVSDLDIDERTSNQLLSHLPSPSGPPLRPRPPSRSHHNPHSTSQGPRSPPSPAQLATTKQRSLTTHQRRCKTIGQRPSSDHLRSRQLPGTARIPGPGVDDWWHRAPDLWLLAKESFRPADN